MFEFGLFFVNFLFKLYLNFDLTKSFCFWAQVRMNLYKLVKIIPLKSVKKRTTELKRSSMDHTGLVYI